MMANEPVSPGQYLRISAKDWNDVRARLRNQRAGGDRNNDLNLPFGLSPSCIIRVWNDSESITYPAQGVVGLPNHAIDPENAPVDNARRPVALAGLPDGVMPYGAALLPIPPGKTGYVVVAGVTSAKIEVTDITHEYAVAISGDNTKLTTATSGPIRLLTRFDSPASNATGLVFVGVISPTGGSGGGTETVQYVTGGNTSLSTVGTWYDVTDEFTLEPGESYHITGSYNWNLKQSGSDASNYHELSFRLYDVTNSTDVSGGPVGGGSSAVIVQSSPVSLIWFVTATTTFVFQAKVQIGAGSPTLTSANVFFPTIAMHSIPTA